LVIGGGPAGITFSRELKNLRPQTEITMLRPEKHSMVYCAIPYAIEGVFDPSKTFKRDELVTDSGVNLIRRAAKKVDLQTKRVVDDAGDIYTADILFIATGAMPLLPPVPGVDAINIYTVKTQDDMEALLANIDNGAKHAVVIGAGAIGIEQAQAYRSRGLDVHLIDMASRVLPAMIDDDMSDVLHETLRGNGIKLMLSTRVERIEKAGERAKRIVLSDGEAIDLNPESDFICFAVGMKPNVELFEGQGLEMGRDGIIIDSRMRTNIFGVYAAGDCCQYLSAIDGKTIGGKLGTNAVPMAKTTAYVVAGMDDEYVGFVNGVATCVNDLRIASTGFTDEVARQRGLETVVGWGETTAIFPMMPGAGTVRVKIVADTRDLRIVGGQVISTLPAADKIDIITLAIQQRLTLNSLSKLSYSAQPWQSFMPARNAIVEACENALDNFTAKGEPFQSSESLECV
jgi:NADH oxidase (H2O2-forming)